LDRSLNYKPVREQIRALWHTCSFVDRTQKLVGEFNYAPIVIHGPSVPDTMLTRLVRDGRAILVPATLS